MKTTETSQSIKTLAVPGEDHNVFQYDGAEVFAALSDSTNKIYQVIVHAGHASCTCPTHGTNCKHIKRVLAARAGF